MRLYGLMVICGIVVAVAIVLKLLGLAEGIQIWITLSLVIITGLYVQETAKIRRSSEETVKATLKQAEASNAMVEEMMQQRYGNILPIIDIQEQDESPHDKIRIGLSIESGKSPEGLLCLLRNIGLGPALDVWTFIITPTNRERRQWDFGAVSINEKTDIERLSIEQHESRGILVAYYKDVYDRPFESSREFIMSSNQRSYKLGPLKIRKLTKEVTSNPQ